jgi:dimethylglycine dehydrogenase
MHYPNYEWPSARNKRLSPIHKTIIELGGVMGVYNGWERANWFSKPGDDISLEACETWERFGPWEKRVKEECENVRDGCGVLDLPGFSRFRVNGVGVAEELRSLCTGSIPKIGRINLIYISDIRGRIVTEMSCVRLSEDDFILITAAAAQWHDRDLLKDRFSKNINIVDETENIDTLIITGPKSRDVLAKISDADLNKTWLTHQTAKVFGIRALIIRVSFAGELGWEIHLKNEDVQKVYDAMKANGAKPFGMYALNSLRIEKGYRAWKGDLTSDYTLLESGLDRFIKFDKPQDFLGKHELFKEKQRGVEKRFVTLIVDNESYDTPYMSTIWNGSRAVGETTSGAWGYRINKAIALGMVQKEFTEPGQKLDIEIYGKRFSATVQKNQPLWDPENKRLRS